MAYCKRNALNCVLSLGGSSVQAPHGTIDIGPDGRPAGLEIFSLDHLIRTARFWEPPSLQTWAPQRVTALCL